MSAPIGNVGTTNGVDKPGATTTTTSTTSANDDDKDMFLKLLIAEMSNQDPSSPTDPSQYMSQMAQFTQVEKMEDLATSQATATTTSQMTAAVSMIGAKIEYGAGDDATSGTVSAVTVIDGVPELLVGTDKVALTDVTKVTAA